MAARGYRFPYNRLLPRHALVEKKAEKHRNRVPKAIALDCVYFTTSAVANLGPT